MIFSGDSADVLNIPDDLTVAQFMLDAQHPLRPIRTTANPWLMDSASGRSYDFEEVRARVHGLAASLYFDYKIYEDDVVALFSPNHIDYPIAIWAAHRLTAVITGANPTFGVEELAQQLGDTKPKILIVHPSFKEVALKAAESVGIPESRVLYFSASSPPDVSSEDVLVDNLVLKGLQRLDTFKERRLGIGESKDKLAFLSCSSGTTGKPKSVAISHFAVMSNILQAARYLASDNSNESSRYHVGDVVVGVLPFFHIYGLVLNLHYMLYAGTTVVVISKFNHEDMLKSIVKYKINHLIVVPPQITLFCKHTTTKNYDISCVRTVFIGGAPFSADLLQQFHQLFPEIDIIMGYGMTEMPTVISMTPPTQSIGTPGSAGRLLPGVQAKVITPEGTLGGYDEPGELVVTGPQISSGYVGNSQATEESFVDGWLHTGDSVVIKENGDVFVVDRLKEIFKVRGFQVSPAELEGCLLSHPDVADVGVIGIPDEFSGEIPMAFITLKADAARLAADDPDAADKIKERLKKYVADAKARYKWLAGGVVLVDSIPKTASGKILRRVLRDRINKMTVN